MRAGVVLEDDNKERIFPLITHRIPWLLIGLAGGIIATIFSSRFEQLLSSHISLAFFIPVIVYMADAVGTQTETIYVRNVAREKIHLSTYMFKEFLVGMLLGTLFGILIGGFAYYWFVSAEIGLTVGFAMFVNIAAAPIVALVIPSLLQKEHTDPALGAGPFTTVIQDLLSLLIYFAIATLIIF